MEGTGSIGGFLLALASPTEKVQINMLHRIVRKKIQTSSGPVGNCLMRGLSKPVGDLVDKVQVAAQSDNSMRTDGRAFTSGSARYQSLAKKTSRVLRPTYPVLRTFGWSIKCGTTYHNWPIILRP